MILSCTKQLLDEIGICAEKLDAAVDPMYTWTANLIRINRRKTLVAVHAASRAVFVLYGITAKHKKILPQLIQEGIRTLLRSEYIKPEIIEEYLEGYGGSVLFCANNVRAHVNYNTFACREVQNFAQNFCEDDLFQEDLLAHINAAPLASKQYQCAYESLEECFAQRYGNALYSCCMLELDVTLDLLTECRRVLRIPDTLNFAQLHQVMQVAFGWHNRHLHEFILETDSDGRPTCIVSPRDDDLREVYHVRRLDPEETQVDEILDRYGKITYVYDFGDGWTHTIKLSDVKDGDGVPYPQCTLAIGDAPMEDSGGPGGFAEIMQILNDPQHPEYSNMKRWVRWQYWYPLNTERLNEILRHVLRV